MVGRTDVLHANVAPVGHAADIVPVATQVQRLDTVLVLQN